MLIIHRLTLIWDRNIGKKNTVFNVKPENKVEAYIVLINILVI